MSTPPRPPPVQKKRATPKRKARSVSSHPTYEAMIAAAIKAIGGKAASRQKIVTYIKANYNIPKGKGPAVQVSMAIKRGVNKGKFVQVNGKGAAGSFRLAAKEVAKKRPAKRRAKRTTKTAGRRRRATSKSPAKRKAARKTAGKRTPVKKQRAAKKKAKARKAPAARKSPVARKSPAKKAKRPAARKTAPKRRQAKK